MSAMWCERRRNPGSSSQLYVTWNQFGPDVTCCGRRHGDYRVVGRALAGSGRRAHCSRMAKPGVGAAVVMPEVNTKAMEAHLADMSRRVSSGAHAVLVLDGAGWRTTPKLRVPDNISLSP